MKMWSGRFRQPLDPRFEEWQRSFPFDQKLLRFELAASRAHAKALAAAGVLSDDELKQVVGALIAIGKDFADANPQDAEAEDVHHFVEKQLVARTGEVGKKLHRAAAAMSRSQRTCGYSSANALMNYGRRSANFLKCW